jgi:hypothetical protein
LLELFPLLHSFLRELAKTLLYTPSEQTLQKVKGEQYGEGTSLEEGGEEGANERPLLSTVS